jgi:hypothetical protein
MLKMTMIEILKNYITACESNLAEIMSADVIDERAVSATEGMIADFKKQLEAL